MSVLQKYSKSSIIEESKARQVCGMKDQITLTDVEYGNPKGEHGRPVRGIETMLRMYLMQTWFNLSKGQRTPYMTATPCVVFLA